MNKETYRKIIKKDKKVEWYGYMVPEGLLTNKVRMWANMVTNNINKLESEMDVLKGENKKKTKSYIDRLWFNVKNAPYTLNGDFTLTHLKSIESEKPTIKTKETTKKVVKTSKSKNHDLIFGKKTNK